MPAEWTIATLILALLFTAVIGWLFTRNFAPELKPDECEKSEKEKRPLR